MKRSRVLQILILIASSLSLYAHGQQEKKPAHSWDVFMNSPEAREAAGKLLGHCGDATTQAVMNACFALEFQTADKEMNSTYRDVLSQLDKDEREHVRGVQRIWLRYRDLHCGAVGSIQAGGGSLKPTEVFSCKADLTKERTKEIRDGYGTPEH